MVVTDSKEKCFICGERKVTGSWIGAQGEIGVCVICATNKLPQLIADAVYGAMPPKSYHSRPVENAQKHLDTIKSNYFEALAKAALPDAKGLSDEELTAYEERVSSTLLESRT
ncbi:hypothetical protein ABVS17_004703 [Vibrio parahaemolyticus]